MQENRVLITQEIEKPAKFHKVYPIIVLCSITDDVII